MRQECKWKEVQRSRTKEVKKEVVLQHEKTFHRGFSPKQWMNYEANLTIPIIHPLPNWSLDSELRSIVDLCAVHSTQVNASELRCIVDLCDVHSTQVNASELRSIVDLCAFHSTQVNASELRCIVDLCVVHSTQVNASELRSIVDL